MRTSIQLLPACIRLPLAITFHLKIKDYIHQWYNQKLDIGKFKTKKKMTTTNLAPGGSSAMALLLIEHN